MKIIRWTYLLPRLAIVLALGLGFRWGLDPLLQWALISGGESTVGAKVEVASLETSLRGGTLVVRGLAVANPNAPLRNLLEAEYAELKLDVDALCHRRCVVQDGRLSGMRFNTQRSTCGLLEVAPEGADESPSFVDPWVESANQFVTAWLDQLDDRLRSDFTAELKTLQIAKQLEQRWPEQYAELDARVKSLHSRSNQLEEGFREVRKNPLRNLAALQDLQAQLLTAQTELKSLHAQVAELPRQAEADRQAVLAARQQDEKFIREQLRLTDFNEEGISQTLLGQPAAESVATALDWLAWARNKIPSAKAKRHAQRSRGTRVLFSPTKPRFLVKQLQLEGTAQWGAQSIALTGSLCNASSEPQLLSEPTRFELRSTGAGQLDIVVTLDRRTLEPHDHLRIACPQFSLPGQTLGSPEKLALAISPSAARLDVDLALNDNQLSGHITLGQSSLALKPQQGALGNKHIAAAFEHALSGLVEWNATVHIAGTLQEPQINIESDLGQQVASGLRTACKQLLRQRADALLAHTEQQVEARLQSLHQIRAEAEQQLLARMGEGEQIFGQLAALSRSGNSRLTIPQLSRSLRSPTLRK